MLDDYLWGRRFGRVQHEGGMVWKYGNPWLYPRHEFEQLKTIVLAVELAQEERGNSKSSFNREKVEPPAEIKQRKMLAAKSFHQAMRNK